MTAWKKYSRICKGSRPCKWKQMVREKHHRKERRIVRQILSQGGVEIAPPAPLDSREISGTWLTVLPRPTPLDEREIS